MHGAGVDSRLLTAMDGGNADFAGAKAGPDVLSPTLVRFYKDEKRKGVPSGTPFLF